MTFIKLYEKSFRENFNFPALSDYGTNLSYTYGALAKEIAKLHILFEECNIKEGDKISLSGKNTTKWGIVYFAILTYGAVVVPILQDFNPNDISHIINHSESVLLFCANSIWNELDKSKFPGLKAAFSLNDFHLFYQKKGENIDPNILHLNAKLNEKYPHGFAPQHINYSDRPNDKMVVLNYTSGTTGFSKGVMTTGNNLSGNMDFAESIFHLRTGNRMLSFLPLAHAYGIAFDFLYAISAGCHVTLLGKTPAPKVLIKAFEDVKPDIIISVPLIFEKLYKNMIIPLLRRRHIKFALRTPLLDKQIYAQIRDKLVNVMGGVFQQVIIGGAAFNSEAEAFLQKVKFPFSVGYGMTECAPLISFSLCKDYVPFSCGKVLDCMQVRIDSEDPYRVPGEIQVRGQNVMLGYYKNEEATRAIFTDDGWLKTGDLGTIDENFNIFIKGRSKTMILGPNGQNIYPEEIESKLDNLPFVMESLVMQKKSKLIALVYPDNDAIKQAGITPKNLSVIMERNRDTLNRLVASYEKIAEIQLYPTEFEKTPKKSIKRFLYTSV
ncbi:MAG: AMP-binding protein [Candidatus Azobacteroides sp.]|nr:AMP-binding protein [Candidatus Azobacteroides sp.]